MESNFAGKRKNEDIIETAMHRKRKFIHNTILTTMNISTIVSNCFIASIIDDGGLKNIYERLLLAQDFNAEVANFKLP